MIVGINGFSQIGKLQLVSFINKNIFKTIIVNAGTNHEKDLVSIVNSLNDKYFLGRESDISIEHSTSSFKINGIKVSFIFCDFKPGEIKWDSNVNIIIETNYHLFDPYADDIDGNCLRGHCLKKANLVVVTGPPFQMNPDIPIMLRENVVRDWCVIVDGVNDTDYSHWNHRIIFIPEPYVICTSKMLLPLFDFFALDQILSISLFHGEKETQINSLYLDKDTNLYNQKLLSLLRTLIDKINYVGLIAERTDNPNKDEASITLVVTLHDSSYYNRKVTPIDKSFISTIFSEYYWNNDNTQSLFIDSGDINTVEDYSFIKIEENKTHTRTKEIRIRLEDDNLKVKLHQIGMTTAIVHGKYKCDPILYCDFITDYLKKILPQVEERSVNGYD